MGPGTKEQHATCRESWKKRIWDIEQFAVTIKHSDGRDMRGDKTGIPMYPYEKMAKNATTVAGWKDQRFSPNHPGLTVDVLSGDTQTAAGNTLLSTVRDSYVED